MSVIFLTVATARNKQAVQLMIDSLRSFGGDLAAAPFWVFAPHPEEVSSLVDGSTLLHPLAAPEPVARYLFGWKVTACARAEEMAAGEADTLVWVDASFLFVQPPVLVDLDEHYDAAFRPVHIRNVGLPISEPLDAFWKGIYTAVGVKDIYSSVTSFVDVQTLRTYFNSHSFSINPKLGLMKRWYEIFRVLVKDGEFQSAACSDESHQIFLFQAILSSLVAVSLDLARVRILPSVYNYPYNLHDSLPPERRLKLLNDTVCFTYEDLSIHPGQVSNIQVNEPLRSWLEAKVQPA